ncbi:hypothetical protein GCM10023331_12630 [Algivirga pacifica]|uniref:Uncharacterized protein n=2 Tax=Algivirga pacifica TaxID=1162670 RepID=A0ABP9D5V0_9BACT
MTFSASAQRYDRDDHPSSRGKKKGHYKHKKHTQPKKKYHKDREVVVVSKPSPRRVKVYRPTRKVVVQHRPSRPVRYAGASVWGRGWRPVGTRISVSTPGFKAVFVKGRRYYYNHGVYCERRGNDYIVINPPMGIEIIDIPEEAEYFDWNGRDYYYYAGTFYRYKGRHRYYVVDAPIGVVVSMLPEGAKVITKYGDTFYRYQGVYYQAIAIDGDVAYVVTEAPRERLTYQLPHGARVVRRHGQQYYKAGDRYYEAVVVRGDVAYRRVYL